MPIEKGEAYRKGRKRKEWAQLAKQGISWSAIAIAVGGLIGYLTATGNDGQPRAAALMSDVRSRRVASKIAEAVPVYYAYCDQERAAGKGQFMQVSLAIAPDSIATMMVLLVSHIRREPNIADLPHHSFNAQQAFGSSFAYSREQS